MRMVNGILRNLSETAPSGSVEQPVAGFVVGRKVIPTTSQSLQVSLTVRVDWRCGVQHDRSPVSSSTWFGSCECNPKTREFQEMHQDDSGGPMM